METNSLWSDREALSACRQSRPALFPEIGGASFPGYKSMAVRAIDIGLPGTLQAATDLRVTNAHGAPWEEALPAPPF